MGLICTSREGPRAARLRAGFCATSGRGGFNPSAPGWRSPHSRERRATAASPAELAGAPRSAAAERTPGSRRSAGPSSQRQDAAVLGAAEPRLKH